ncbi:tetratricopeptide repeat protein [Methylacidiphilales bacterium]|nr:tetratricopeptide repeat protein [Candidatus Methylacidiphilales bacterium]
MRTKIFISFALALTLIPGGASAQTTDPAKIADFEKRYAQGQDLEQQGKLTEARAVFDGILAEEPDAKGSLREAGFISLRLNESLKADDYFEKLHALAPDYPLAIELLIQINQSLGRDVKVERLVKEFHALHDSGKVPDFSKSLCFVRERIHGDQQETVISEFFDYTKDPNTVWMAEVMDANGQLKRRILLNYDPDATQAIRAKDPKYAGTEIFTWFEHVIKDQRIKEIDAYLQIFALPEYKKFRSAMQVIMTSAPKPIYSQAVDVPVQ